MIAGPFEWGFCNSALAWRLWRVILIVVSIVAFAKLIQFNKIALKICLCGGSLQCTLLFCKMRGM